MIGNLKETIQLPPIHHRICAAINSMHYYPCSAQIIRFLAAILSWSDHTSQLHTLHSSFSLSWIPLPVQVLKDGIAQARWLQPRASSPRNPDIRQPPTQPPSAFFLLPGNQKPTPSKSLHFVRQLHCEPEVGGHQMWCVMAFSPFLSLESRHVGYLLLPTVE